MITRSFTSARGLIVVSFDPESPDSPILIDHSNAFFLTVDEAHQFYSLMADFLQAVRRVPSDPAGSKPIPKKGAPSREEYEKITGKEKGLKVDIEDVKSGPPHNSIPPTNPEPG